MKLSEKIIFSRKKQGLSQVDLADALGVSRQSVSKWETDEAKPDINKLPALAKALNVSIDWLLSEEDTTDNKEDRSCDKEFANQEAIVKAYPDWVDRIPGFMGTAVKKYGWLYGVRIFFGGIIFTVFGIVARVMSYNFIFGGRHSVSYGPMNEIAGNQMFAENGVASSDAFAFGVTDYFGSSAFAEINNRAWSGFSAITGLIIGIGIIMTIGGIILTVVLKQWSKKEDVL